MSMPTLATSTRPGKWVMNGIQRRRTDYIFWFVAKNANVFIQLWRLARYTRTISFCLHGIAWGCSVAIIRRIPIWYTASVQIRHDRCNKMLNRLISHHIDKILMSTYSYFFLFSTGESDSQGTRTRLTECQELCQQRILRRLRHARDNCGRARGEGRGGVRDLLLAQS